MTDYLSTRWIARNTRRMASDTEKERLAQALRDADAKTFTEAVRAVNSPEYNRGWAAGNASALDACNPIIEALTVERDALAEDEHVAFASSERLLNAAQEYFEATLPLLNDYPLTDPERRKAWKRLREANAGLRVALDEAAMPATRL